MIGGTYDTMDPKYMEWMSTQVQHGRSITANAGHVSQYDDPETYFTGLIKFIKDVNDEKFNQGEKNNHRVTEGTKKPPCILCLCSKIYKRILNQ